MESISEWSSGRPSPYGHISAGLVYNFNPNSLIYIRPYNYIPDEFNFYKISEEEELYLGCEIEVDLGGESEYDAAVVHKIMNENESVIYCKHDGSLSCGFEIVTHPCTYEYHKSLNYHRLFDTLTSNGYRAHDTKTCGLHVHINRNYFGDSKLEQDLSIAKLLYLFEKFWDKIELISRRSDNRFARRFKLNDNETPLDIYAKSKNSDKYGAINLYHEDTVEIRVFKGTLNLNTYFCTLEFVKIIAKLVKETDIFFIQGVMWEDISQLFSDELNEYIADRIRKRDVKMKEIEPISEPIISPVVNNGVLMPNLFDGYYSMLDGMRTTEQHFSSFDLAVENSRTLQAIERESLSEAELLRNKIKVIKQEIRRCRNELGRINLQRELGRLERDLADSRRCNRV